MPLDEVAEVVLGQSPPGHAYNEEQEGLPLLNGPTEFGEFSPVARQWTSVVTKTSEPGDLLISIRASIGRTNWADRIYCIGRGLAAIRPGPRIEGEYLRQVLIEQTSELRELSAGTTFLNLPGHRLRSIRIPVPSLDDQRSAARILARMEALDSRLLSAIVRRRRLVASIEASALNSAFAGLA